MRERILGVAAALLIVAIASDSLAQPAPPPGTAPPPGAAPPPVWNTHWTSAQLEQLAAPIALYPDPLLGSILAASTYPLEVVEAARWLDDPAHAALTGDALAVALQDQRWDASVKSLVPFAAVLRNMDSDLEWTEQLGDAFLAQPADLMDAVQRLRQRAVAQGALQSTPQQTVTTDQNLITIEPTNPDVVYVPYYVPAIYGPWPWAGYPPYDFGLPPDVFLGGAFIGFGIGIGFFEPWGWYGCNWPGHGIVVYPPYWRPGNPPRLPNPRPTPEPWHHDPLHRDGVPYRDAATAARYLGAQAAGRRDYRGFPAPATPAHAPQTPPPQATPVPRPSYERPTAPERPAMPERPVAPAPRAAPPAFESFGHGPQVRSEAARGSSSRSAPPAPSGGGGHPGHR
ncbi:MAG TPA: DUF3300 domain-containing protein [Steroidobacteraceae bacterium]|nr:DUF3300 domain-containing protein [Steroidobacteraceae bacterium]